MDTAYQAQLQVSELSMENISWDAGFVDLEQPSDLITCLLLPVGMDLGKPWYSSNTYVFFSKGIIIIRQFTHFRPK